MFRTERDAKTRAERDVVTFYREGGIKCLGQLVRDSDGTIRVGILQEDSELVTTESRQNPRVRHDVLQTLTDLLQKLISIAVAERVVHVLEAVEIHHQQCERLARLLAGA